MPLAVALRSTVYGAGRTARSGAGIRRYYQRPGLVRSIVNTMTRHQSTTRTLDGNVGVSAALALAEDEEDTPRPTLFTREFSLADRVALVSGANSGIGLEMALALAEAGARAVYCVDLPSTPSETWEAARAYASRMGAGRIVYVSGDVTDQERMWKIGEEVGNKEGRMDVCIAAAGVAKDAVDCLDCPAELFRQVIDVNTNGVLFTAQAAGRQMMRFGRGGSIILVASMAGRITMQDVSQVSYNTSKGAVLQMTRSMACELAPRGIRVNSLSPGWIHTNMIAAMVEADPEYFKRVAPMNRIGRPHELRGATAWLASDASSFCTGSDILVDGGLCAW